MSQEPGDPALQVDGSTHHPSSGRRSRNRISMAVTNLRRSITEGSFWSREGDQDSEGPPLEEIDANMRARFRASLSATSIASSEDDMAVGKTKSSAKITSKFIGLIVDRADSDCSLFAQSQGDRILAARQCVWRLLRSNQADFLFVSVMLVNIVLGCMEVNLLAEGDAVPGWLAAGIQTCFALYLLEIMLIMFVKRWRFFRRWWSLLEIILCACGLSESVIHACGLSDSSDLATLASVLRVARLLRFARILRKLTLVREANRIFSLLLHCMKMLILTFLVCFGIMTVWSTAAVELLDPLAREIKEQGAWQDCEHCGRSLSSTHRASLLLFETVMAGDAWGRVAVPIIDAYPWAAVMFVSIYLLMAYGILNLAVAAAVDAFSERRRKDVTFLAVQMDEEQEKDMRELRKIFAKLDADRSGELSLDELTEGIRQIREFSHRLRVMDIDEHDLEQLFKMLDEDGSGTVEPEEFIYFLNRWLTESRTATRFAKYNTMHSLERQAAMETSLRGMVSRLEARVGQVNENLMSLSSTMTATMQRPASQRAKLDKAVEHKTDGAEPAVEDKDDQQQKSEGADRATVFV